MKVFLDVWCSQWENSQTIDSTSSLMKQDIFGTYNYNKWLSKEGLQSLKENFSVKAKTT